MSTSAKSSVGVGPIHLEAEPEAIALDPSTTALVVVDMQNAYLSKGGYLDRVGFDVSTSAPVIETSARVLAAAREVGLFVVHLQNGFDALQTEAGGPTAPVWHKSNALKYMRANPSARGQLITYGTWDYEIVDALKPISGEAVVPKARYSGFAGTNLEQLLRARGITTLLLVGVNTNVCVESTLRDAYHREFFAVMVPDATLQAGSDSIFEASVFNVQKFFGWTARSDAVVRAFTGAAKLSAA
ncbi:isochorismatase family protein [Pseudorhodoplanes sinuspersici]|uniref:Pyrimidine utilization protein B n=1 Tax=Pseudorhodoplanes sinuspersici TaxID=1235591 RepID=A0A1W6ZME7_9HYPH|nr:isochorismatase family protein [Pseudorhodoplanes sinuspersici]ARP98492.1 pyrimidine utilization protein B [Pseudorhodoplanes sinuspersici]RKE65922.1 ureidoacrylate peracid hydrolase [Pseudorhodoplanes sinuspersici]